MLQAKIRSIDGHQQIDPTIALGLLSDLQLLLSQTETALASMDDDVHNINHACAHGDHDEATNEM